MRDTVTTWTRPGEAIGLVLRGHTARTAVPVAAIVGTVLSVVNQGAVVTGGDATAGTWLRIAVNYAVPFVVASVGYLSARRGRVVPASTPPRR